MNGWKAFYKGKSIEIYAEPSKTLLQVRSAAAKFFKAKKEYDVTVFLCEKAGRTIEHVATF